MEPALSAKAAGLHYISDERPGIRRLGSGKRFRYINTRGKPLRDPETLRRIRKLAIPPAWRSVWISPDPDGHLQAVGRDARGRKQYRYHPEWRQVRDSTKYHRMYAFGHVLPKIRARVASDLRKSGLTREKVLATLVRLLDETSIRVGNEEYIKENHSFVAVESVARELGNTVAVCRKSYIHPALFDAYMSDTLKSDLKAPHRRRGLSAQESAVLAFLSIRKMTKAAA